MLDYRRIEAWSEADKLAVAVYDYTRAFPAEERDGLVAEFRKAVRLVPTSIAKGSACEAIPDYLAFLHRARCALIDVDYCLRLSIHLGYVDKEEQKVLKALIRSTCRRLEKLLNRGLEETAKRSGTTDGTAASVAKPTLASAPKGQPNSSARHII